jgi:DNA polymerase III sliding clamp (beta) subunit (PCNA family)
MRIQFNAKLLAAVALAQSDEKSRYYLCGVCFHDNTAVATNGHLLTKATSADTDNGEEQHIMPVSKKAITAMKNKKAENVIFENDVLSVMDIHEQVLFMEPCKEIDGTFPDYTKVIPTDTGDVCNAAFAAHYLGIIAETGGILDKSNVPVSFKGSDKSSPHIVTYHGYPGLMSVVMPLRT